MKPSERIQEIYNQNRLKDTDHLIHSFEGAIVDYLDEEWEKKIKPRQIGTTSRGTPIFDQINPNAL